MLVSIATIVKDNKNFISHTLESILNQSYKNIELIVIDGGSQDFTDIIVKKYFKEFKLISRIDNNVYKGINFAHKVAKGEYLTLLHSGDIYLNKDVIANFVKNSNKNDILSSNILYYDSNLDVKRIWKVNTNQKFYNNSFKYPHTSFFYSSKIYKNFFYDESLKISSDSKFLSILSKKNISHKHLNFFSICMFHKGLSTKFSTFLKRTIEDLRYLKEQNKYLFLFYYLKKILEKLKQFKINRVNKLKFHSRIKINHLALEKKLLKKKINIINYSKKKIKLINNPNKLINSDVNFVLSALNLAFLGSYFSEKLNIYKDLYHWPDGYFPLLFIKKFRKFNKIPGRDLLKKIKLNKKIKKIHVLGNLDFKQKQLLKKMYKKKILHTNLPYANEYKIARACPKLQKNVIYFLSIPTPKQEAVAELLIIKNNYYKIILIGGSINILSNREKPVPNKIIYLEFLWRLRFDTKIRFKRLIVTLFQFIYYSLIKDKFNDV